MNVGGLRIVFLFPIWLFLAGCSSQNVEFAGFNFGSESEKNSEISVKGADLYTVLENSELVISMKLSSSNPNDPIEVKIDFGSLNSAFQNPISGGVMTATLSAASPVLEIRQMVGPRISTAGTYDEFDVKVTNNSKSTSSPLYAFKVRIEAQPFSVSEIKVNGLSPSPSLQALNNVYSVSGRCSKPNLEIKLKRNLGDIATDPEVPSSSIDLVSGRCQNVNFSFGNLNTASFSEGLNSLYIEVKDGNVVSRSSFFDIKIDRVPPAILDFKLDANLSNSNYWSNVLSQSPAISAIQFPNGQEFNDSNMPTFSADSGTSWDLLEKKISLSTTPTISSTIGSKIFSSLSSSSLSYGSNFTTILSEGIQYYLFLQLKDEAGNTATFTKSFNVDVTFPQFTFGSTPLVNSRFLLGPLKWTLAIDDVQKTWIKVGTTLGGIDVSNWIEINPTAPLSSTMKEFIFTAPTPLQNGGSYYWSLKVRDHAGNETISENTNPVVVGISQHAYVKGFNTTIGDEFGTSVDIDGDTMVVGVPKEDSDTSIICDLLDFSSILLNLKTACDNDLKTDSGAVYVYRKNPVSGIWSLESYIKSPEPHSGDSFGYAVSVSGDRIAVSAPGVDDRFTGVTNGGIMPSAVSGGSDVGAVYTFKRTNHQWTFESYVKSDSYIGQDRFGESIELNENYLIVGQIQSVSGIGRAVLYKFEADSWAHHHSFAGPGTTVLNRFGSSVSLTIFPTLRVLVGAPFEDSDFNSLQSNITAENDNLSDSGAAYLWEKESGGFVFKYMIKPPNPDVNDNFGSSVSISGSMIAIGSPGEDSAQRGVFGQAEIVNDGGMTDSGAVYIFSFDGFSAVSLRHYIKGRDNYVNDLLGKKLVLSGNHLLIGVPEMDDLNNTIGNGNDYVTNTQVCPGANCNSGGALLYSVTQSTCSQIAVVRPTNNSASYSISGFGNAVGMDSTGNIVIGAFREHHSSQEILNQETAPAPNVSTSSYFGAAYIYKR